MTTPLILLTHGSRHPNALPGLQRLAAAVTRELEVPVELAHLEFSPDTLEVVCGRLAEQGHHNAIVVPLLFSQGYHAESDVPEQISRVACLKLHLAKGLGMGEDIVHILAQRILEQPGSSDVVLYPVGSSRREAKAQYEQLAANLSRRINRHVALVPATSSQRKVNEYPGRHVVPLFVTDGLLLDQARRQLAGASMTMSEALTWRLAPVVIDRYVRCQQLVPAAV